MYFTILATGSIAVSGWRARHQLGGAAAEALRPLAGDAAGALFALEVVGVGFLAVPVMTAGAAYDLAQTLGWKHGLHARPAQAKKFYAAIAAFTLLGVTI